MIEQAVQRARAAREGVSLAPTLRKCKQAAKEEAIFRAVEHAPHDRTFRGRLYHDGVPTPSVYLAQRVRVLFVCFGNRTCADTLMATI